MGARKNRPDKFGAGSTQKSGSKPIDQVRSVCEELGLKFKPLSGGGQDAFYELDSTASVFSKEFFCCLLSYNKKMDRWGATHNSTLSESDKDRLRFGTAKEAVLWYKKKLDEVFAREKGA